MFKPLGCQAAKQEHGKSAALTSSTASNKVFGRFCCLFEAFKLISLSVINAGGSISVQEEKETVDFQSNGLLITI